MSVPKQKKKIQTDMRKKTYETSSDLGKEKGVFPIYNKEKYMEGEFIKIIPNWVKDKILKNASVIAT